MGYIVKKIIQLFLTLFVVSLITFFAFWVVPGDPARIMLGPNATDAQVQNLSTQLGLDQPLPTRYVQWLGGTLRGELGNSLSFNQPVSDLIAQRMPVTLGLSVISLLMTIVASFPLGLLAARRPGKWMDQLFSVVSHTFFSMPPFVVALLLTLMLGLVFNLFVVGQYTSIQDSFWGFVSSLIVPSLAIALPKIAMAMKFLRSSIISESQKEYVRTAKSHGLSDGAVMRKHILPNALVPIITVFSIISSEILGGSLIVEQTFNLPGLGRLLLQGIGGRDFLLTQGIVIYLAFMIVLVYFSSDILHSLVDPRIRLK